MPNIYVDQLNFEFEESNTYADILSNLGLNTPRLVEQIVSNAHIYVDIVNLEVPVNTNVIADVCTNTGTGTQTCDEEIIGTPVPAPVGGGTADRIRVLGGRPWYKEDIYVTNSAQQLIGEEILIGEIAEAYAYNIPNIDATIRRPIYAKPKTIEILSFSPVNERTIVIPTPEPVEEPKTNSRQKEEEELLLLGII